MKYVKQFGWIMAMSLLGEVLHIVLPLPVPASIYGLLLMLAALCSGVIKLKQVEETGDFLIEIMPLMFIPAAVGLLDTWADLKEIWFPVTIITVLTTIFVMVTAGRVTQYVIRRRNKEHTDKA